MIKNSIRFSGYLFAFLFIAAFLGCKAPNFDNPCDPNSKAHQDSLIAKAVTGDKSVFCLVASASTGTSTVTSGTSTGTSTGTGTGVAVTLTGFSFVDTTNELSQTYSGTISGTSISINLPYGKASAAIPTLTTNAVTILAGGSAFTSGVTPVDFSSPVTFTLTSSTGSVQIYTVTAYLVAPVEDTGQDLCYVEGFNTPAVSVACATSAATYPRQDGDFVGFPNAKGYQMPTVNAGYPSDYINKNTVKGIVWKTCAEGWSDATCSTGSTNNMDLPTATAACDALNTANAGAGYAGLKTWRLPSFQELLQLQTYNQNGIFMDSTYFPNAQNVNHKSSTIVAGTGNVLSVNGGIGSSAPVTLEAVRCVAGSPYPAQDLVDNGDGTILDKRTSLVWEKCALGQSGTNCATGTATNYNEPNGLTACQSEVLAGKSWRLPNNTEMLSIFDPTQIASPYVNATYFPTPSVSIYRTSTTVFANDAYAYEFDSVNLTLGTTNNKSTGAAGYQARCVSGP